MNESQVSNLSLWESVQKTDPKHVKKITGKSYEGSSPSPHWLVRKATETFGPCGLGWGFSVVDERIEDAGEAGKMSFARVRVWYMWNGIRGEVEHVGGTPFSGRRSSGKAFADEDAPKKSVTDALVKALSMVGFAGDIFLGRWDDSKYQAELRDEFADKPQEDTSSIAARKYVEMALPIVERTKSAVDLKEWWDREAKTRSDLLDALQHSVIKQAVTEKVNQLNAKDREHATV